MSAQAIHYYTPAEYLALEREASTKSEFYGGEIFAMSGASRGHNLVAGNVYTVINNTLIEEPCESYISDMRVLVEDTGLYTYPDVVVVCEEPRFEDENVDTLRNPTFLMEVLSDSTERYDRGKKAAMYRRIPSLREYLLVAQDRPHAELYTRQNEGGWRLTEAIGLDGTLNLESIGCTLPLTRVYAKVRFPDAG